MTLKTFFLLIFTPTIFLSFWSVVVDRKLSRKDSLDEIKLCERLLDAEAPLPEGRHISGGSQLVVVLLLHLVILPPPVGPGKDVEVSERHCPFATLSKESALV